jgi:hypothetical protein
MIYFSKLFSPNDYDGYQAQKKRNSSKTHFYFNLLFWWLMSTHSIQILNLVLLYESLRKKESLE